MAKLGIHNIREEGKQIVLRSAGGISKFNLVAEICSRHPETDKGTIRTQLSKLADTFPTLIRRPRRGFFLPVTQARIDTETSDPRPNDISRLTAIGFVRIGCWNCSDQFIALNVSAQAPQRDFLYAFVSGREVLYVGKSTLSFSQRMAGYQRPSRTARTNWRNHHNMREILRTGGEIEIFVWTNSAPLRLGEFAINLAAGLEDTLIRELRTPWNGMRAVITKHESPAYPLPARLP